MVTRRTGRSPLSADECVAGTPLAVAILRGRPTLTYSRVFYEPYVVATGESVGPISEYEDATYEALLEVTHRLIEIQDIEFETREALAEGLASTECAVRFVRAERLKR